MEERLNAGQLLHKCKAIASGKAEKITVGRLDIPTAKKAAAKKAPTKPTATSKTKAARAKEAATK